MRHIESGTLEGSRSPRGAARPARPDGSARVRSLSCAAAALLGLLAASSHAVAQDTTPTTMGTGVGRGALGFGYAQTLSQVGGLNLVYDPGPWHADAILGFSGNGSTQIRIAGRGWFHMHATGASDFSLGGGLALLNTNPDGAAPATNSVYIELGAMVRFFAVSNVSISLFGGLAVGAADADGFVISAQPLSQLAVTYFF